MTRHQNESAAMAARGWPDRRYQCICTTCDQHFIGHKRDLECRLCEEERLKRVARTYAPVGQLFLGDGEVPITIDDLQMPDVIYDETEVSGRVEFVPNEQLQVNASSRKAPTALAQVAYEAWADEQPQPGIEWERLPVPIQTIWRRIVGDVLVHAAPIMWSEIQELRAKLEERPVAWVWTDHVGDIVFEGSQDTARNWPDATKRGLRPVGADEVAALKRERNEYAQSVEFWIRAEGDAVRRAEALQARLDAVEGQEAVGFMRPADNDGGSFWCSKHASCYYSVPVYASPPSKNESQVQADEVAALTKERDEYAEMVNLYAQESRPEAMTILAKDRDKHFDRAEAAEARATTAEAQVAALRERNAVVTLDMVADMKRELVALRDTPNLNLAMTVSRAILAQQERDRAALASAEAQEK